MNDNGESKEMSEKELPKVFIFEGGDVCGKTTQLEKIYDELCKRKDENLEVYKFKFPNRSIKLNLDTEGKLFLPDDIINDLTYLRDNGIISVNENFEWNIYSIFDALHKYIYNSSPDDIIKNWELILKLMKADIVLNALDKFNWITKTYADIVKSKKESIILIDRFIDSGYVYNCRLPTSYLYYKFHYYEDEEKKNFYKTMTNDLYKINLLNKYITFTFYVCIENIKSNNTQILPEIFKKSVDCHDNINYLSVNLNDFNINNFNILMFNSSQILYNKFKSDIASNDNSNLNREVSQYDTNEFLRTIVSQIFDEISLDNGTNIYYTKINIDLLISIYNNCCVDKDDSVEFCKNEIMGMLGL